MSYEFTFITVPTTRITDFSRWVAAAFEAEIVNDRRLTVINPNESMEFVVVRDADAYADGPEDDSCVRSLPGFPSNLKQAKYFDVEYRPTDAMKEVIARMADSDDVWVQLHSDIVYHGPTFAGLVRANPGWNWDSAIAP